MSLVWNPWALVGLVAAPLMIALAVVVYRARPRRTQNRVLALVLMVAALCDALTTALRFLVTDEADAAALWTLRMLGVFTTSALLLVFYSTFETPLARPMRSRLARLLVAAITLGILVAFLALPRLAPRELDRYAEPGVWSASPDTLFLAIAFSVAALAVAYGIPVSISAARRARTGRERRQMRLVAAALLFFIGAGTAITVITLPSFVEGAEPPAGIVLLNIVGPSVVGAIFVMIVSYGILRAQIFDVDLKLKWTLKQSTVAAIFIGLFFVVSESVAEFFSERTGTYVGILAAGGLLFALAPLQHLAQRIADKAMPGVKPASDMTSAERIAVYEDAARGAWADGQLSADERAMLDRLGARLSITAHDARRIESAAAGADRGAPRRPARERRARG